MKIIFMPHRRRSRSWRRRCRCRRHRRQMVSRVERRVVVVGEGEGGRKRDSEWVSKYMWSREEEREKEREGENLLGNALCWTKRVVVEITERERENDRDREWERKHSTIIGLLVIERRQNTEICICGILAKTKFSYSGTYRTRLLCVLCSCKQLL